MLTTRRFLPRVNVSEIGTVSKHYTRISTARPTELHRRVLKAACCVPEARCKRNQMHIDTHSLHALLLARANVSPAAGRRIGKEAPLEFAAVLRSP